ncbi:RNA polymerase sigma factor [Akkermansiaceae bacterium]|nr:RNA polymerase sigma factor [Akkermansiaceae bacterium]
MVPPSYQEEAPEPCPDADLIRRVLGGEDKAWQELLDYLTPAVSRTVCTHLRRSADREDVVQETLTRIFLGIHGLKNHAKMAAWAKRIAINTCHDWLRKMKARPAISWTDLDPAEANMLSQSMGGSMEGSEGNRDALYELIDKLVATLKPREQIVIRLLDLENRSVQDACGITGWGESKVKVTAMRARRKLAAQFQRLNEISPRTPNT